MHSRMILADCRDALPKIPSDSVDLVLTDPPYNTGLKASNSTRFAHFFDDALPADAYRALARDTCRELLRRPIEHASAPGDLVLDPFAATGTTCIVARKLGRRFLGIERKSRYHAFAVAELARTRPDAAPARCGGTWRETPCEAVHHPRPRTRRASRARR